MQQRTSLPMPQQTANSGIESTSFLSPITEASISYIKGFEDGKYLLTPKSYDEHYIKGWNSVVIDMTYFENLNQNLVS